MLIVFALLAAVSLPQYLQAQALSRVVKARQDMARIAETMLAYQLDTKHTNLQRVQIQRPGFPKRVAAIKYEDKAGDPVWENEVNIPLQFLEGYLDEWP